MPRMQEAVTTLNAAFGAEGLRNIGLDIFGARAGVELIHPSLSEVFVRAGAELSPATRRYVDSWPSGLQAAVKGVLQDNLERAGTVPVTFAWAPGYDYEVTIWDVRDTTETAGGITVLFKSRYPDDPHPLDGETASSA